jgi:VanZ family protein
MAGGRSAWSVLDLVLWVLTVFCAAITVWFSFGAPPPGVNLFPYADKAEHALAYFATTSSFLFAAVWRPGRGSGRWPRGGLWFVLSAILTGGAIEILQGMTSTRSAQFLDLVAEALGAGVAVGFHALIRRRWAPMAQPSAALNLRP